MTEANWVQLGCMLYVMALVLVGVAGWKVGKWVDLPLDNERPL